MSSADALLARLSKPDGPARHVTLDDFTSMPAVPMLLWCPVCHARHIDEGEYATNRHHTHACRSCGVVWRPALIATVGVAFLPGFKNPETR